MNKLRRKEINEIANEVENLQNRIEALSEEEQDYQDNMPENLQGSERWELADQAICQLGEAINSLEEVLLALESAAE